MAGTSPPHYLPLDQPSANWLFQVVSRRYEKGSIILTFNRAFAAIVDRLLPAATVLNIRGWSYRMRAHDWGQVFADPVAPTEQPGGKNGRRG